MDRSLLGYRNENRLPFLLKDHRSCPFTLETKSVPKKATANRFDHQVGVLRLVFTVVWVLITTNMPSPQGHKKTDIFKVTRLQLRLRFCLLWFGLFSRRFEVISPVFFFVLAEAWPRHLPGSLPHPLPFR